MRSPRSRSRAASVTIAGGIPTPPAVAAGLPQSAAIVGRWSAADIPAQADNTPLASWTDSVGGLAAVQATAALQPRYRTAGANGKPFVQFAQTQKLDAGAANAVMAAASDAKDFTVVVVVRNVQPSEIGFIFSASNASGVTVHANGTNAGVPAAGSLRIPYSSTALSTIGQVQGKPDVSLCRCYINGTAFSPAGKMTVSASNPSNRITLGGNSGNPDFGFAGELYDVIAWNQALTHPEMMQVEKWVRDRYAVPYPWAGQPYRIFDGDSLTQGTGASAVLGDYPARVAASNGWPIGTWTNLGYSGITMDAMRARAPSELDPIPGIVGGAVPTHLAAWEWYNQRGKPDGNAAYLSTRGYFNDRRAAGIGKLLVLTSTDASDNAETPDQRTKRAEYNGLIASNWPSFATAYVGIHTDARIGAEGACPASAPFGVYFEDGVHLTDAGYAVLAELVAPAMA